MASAKAPNSHTLLTSRTAGVVRAASVDAHRAARAAVAVGWRPGASGAVGVGASDRGTHFALAIHTAIARGTSVPRQSQRRCTCDIDIACRSTSRKIACRENIAASSCNASPNRANSKTCLTIRAAGIAGAARGVDPPTKGASHLTHVVSPTISRSSISCARIPTTSTEGRREPAQRGRTCLNISIEIGSCVGPNIVVVVVTVIVITSPNGCKE